MDYWRVNFRIALLEHFLRRATDETVLKREEFWKSVLMTRGERGFNRNCRLFAFRRCGRLRNSASRLARLGVLI